MESCGIRSFLWLKNVSFHVFNNGTIVRVNHTNVEISREGPTQMMESCGIHQLQCGHNHPREIYCKIHAFHVLLCRCGNHFSVTLTVALMACTVDRSCPRNDSYLSILIRQSENDGLLNKKSNIRWLLLKRLTCNRWSITVWPIQSIV